MALARALLLLRLLGPVAADSCSAQVGCGACVASGCAWEAVAFKEQCVEVDTCKKDKSKHLGLLARPNLGLGHVTIQPPFCTTDAAGCCAEDTNHAQGAQWLCDDQCSNCICTGGMVIASGCTKGGGNGQPLEAYVVQLAIIPVLACFCVCAAICWVMLCCRRKAQRLPMREMKTPEEEEEDQLAPGD